MSDQNIGLLLKLILDKVSKNETKKGLSEVADTVEKTGKSISELTAKEKELSAAIKEQQKKTDAAKNGLEAYSSNLEKAKKKLEANPSKTYLEKYVKTAEAGVKHYTDKLAEEEKQLASLRGERLDTADVIKKETKELNELAKAAGVTPREFKKLSQEQQNAARTTLDAQKKLEAYNRELAKTEAKIQDLRRLGASIGQISQGMFLAGSAIVGAIYLSANKEAQRIKEAGGEVDETTKRWLRAQDIIQRSYQRIGDTAMTAFLPLLEKAAELAEKTSKFVEENPDLVKAALNVGGALAVVGALGMAVSKGIIFAANLMNAANTLKQLTGIGGTLSKVGMTGSLVGATSIASTVATVLAVIAAGAVLGAIIYDLIAKLAPKLGLPRFGSVAAGGANLAGQGMEKLAVAGGMDEAEAKRKTLVFTYNIGRIFGAIKEGDSAWQSVVDGAKAATGGLDDLGSSMESEAEAMKVLNGLAEDEAKALREYADDVSNINRDAQKSFDDAGRDYKKAIGEIPEKLEESIGKIRASLRDTLSKLAADFQRENLEAEREYQNQRAEITADGAENARKIEEDKNKQLQEIEKDHARTLSDLIDERDARAIYKENEAYEERKTEVENSAQEQLREAQRETEQQIEEAQRNYNEQRRIRAEEYSRQQAEARAKAASDIAEARAKAEEEKKVAAEKYAEQKLEIERNRQQALADLKINFDIERRERAMAAMSQIKELGGALNAEAMLRRQYYGVMLTDTANFMNSQRSLVSQKSTGISGSKASGGYMANGLYRVHGEEFVVNKQTTKSLESLIGGRLSQQALLMTAAGGSGVGKGVTWNDHRHFDADVSQASRDAIFKDTIAILDMAMKGA